MLLIYLKTIGVLILAAAGAVVGLLFLLVAGWISIAFHVFALVYIGKGYQALRSLRRVVPPQSSALAEGKV